MMPDPQERTHYYDYENEDELAPDYVDDDLHDDMAHVHSDDELEIVVKELLHNSHQIDSSDITVSVDKTNVHLSGSVKSQSDRDYAVKIVKLIHGVGNVDSDIVVKLNQGILPTDIGRNP